MTALSDFTPLQGGVPVVVDDQVVGGIGVSGAASAQQDEEIAIAGANAAKNLTAGPAAGASADVLYFDKEKVAAAFGTGAVLLGGDGGRNYMIHASRRDKAGMAEVHAKDADIIYVIDGSATFITGGTVVDPKTTEPDEIRGTEIRGGETRQISKGDVIVVPNNTPHWFREVPGSLTYYVVKVR